LQSYAESKLEGLEEQLHRFKSQVDDLTRSNQDLSSVKTRLTTEISELQRQLQEAETNSGSSTKIKIQLQSQLEEVKLKLETESRVSLRPDRRGGSSSCERVGLTTQVRLDIANFSFGNRIGEQWNHLPGDVVSSSSVNIFKGRLDNYLRTIGGLK